VRFAASRAGRTRGRVYLSTVFKAIGFTSIIPQAEKT
jgi:hypothetical protein